MTNVNHDTTDVSTADAERLARRVNEALGLTAPAGLTGEHIGADRPLDRARSNLDLLARIGDGEPFEHPVTGETCRVDRDDPMAAACRRLVAYIDRENGDR